MLFLSLSFLDKGFNEPWVLLVLLLFYYLIDIETTQPLSALNVPKAKYVHLVLEWCHTHLKHPNTKKPTVVLRYYMHKQFKGFYNPSSHEIVVYVNAHQTVQSLTNTVIHEYIHARQYTKRFNRLYAQYNHDKGYWNNPFELEARKVSKQYEQQCVKALLS